MVDLDGVLVDFSEACSRWFGVKVTSYNAFLDVGISPNDFWESVSDVRFWREAPWTEFGRELFALISESFEQVYIATSPIRRAESAMGKIEWIQRNTPSVARKYFITPYKHLLGHPNRVLVDDQDDNCNGFAFYGGTPFLVPQEWNTKGKGDPIKEFKEWLTTRRG